jgi:hypothetical protein
MTPTMLWPVLAAVVALAVGIVVAAAHARARIKPVGRDCAGFGHVYKFSGIGLHCLRCGSYMAPARTTVSTIEAAVNDNGSVPACSASDSVARHTRLQVTSPRLGT